MTVEISVLIPTYNVSEYISDCLESVFSQKFDSFDVWILDGGSTDETIPNCRDFPVQIIEEAGGLSEALNIGIESSNGKYIARADADTVMHQGRLKKQYEFLEENPQYGIVGGHARKIYEESGESFIDRKPTSHKDITKKLVTKSPMVHPTLMIRREAILDAGLYRQYLWEDWELVSRIVFETRFKAMNIDAVLMDVMKRQESVTLEAGIIEHVLGNLTCSYLSIFRHNGTLWQKARLIPAPIFHISKKGLEVSKNTLINGGHTETWD